jgi:hypothetical protein
MLQNYRTLFHNLIFYPILFFGVILAMTSCSTLSKSNSVDTIVYTPIPTVDRPRPVDLKDIKWDVVTKENLEEYLASKDDLLDGYYVFYAISVKDYEKLSLNYQELKRYIIQQKEIIDYYEQAIK